MFSQFSYTTIAFHTAWLDLRQHLTICYYLDMTWYRLTALRCLESLEDAWQFPSCLTNFSQATHQCNAPNLSRLKCLKLPQAHSSTVKHLKNFSIKIWVFLMYTISIEVAGGEWMDRDIVFFWYKLFVGTCLHRTMLKKMETSHGYEESMRYRQTC